MPSGGELLLAGLLRGSNRVDHMPLPTVHKRLVQLCGMLEASVPFAKSPKPSEESTKQQSSWELVVSLCEHMQATGEAFSQGLSKVMVSKVDLHTY